MATVRIRCPTDDCDGEIVLAPQGAPGGARFLAGRCSVCARMWRLIAGEPEPLDVGDLGIG